MKANKIFWGLLLIGGGVLLALYAFGVGVEYNLFNIVASVILLGIAGASLYRFRFFLFMIPLALITYIWREALGIPDIKVWILLAAAAVLGIGLSVIFHKASKKSWCTRHGDDHKWEKNEEVLNQDEQVDIEGNFGEFSKFVHAGNLKRVRIRSNMCSMKVYFDQCQVSPEGLEIFLRVNLAGVELHVPKNWQIDNQLSVTLGEVNETNHTGAEGDVKVKLAGQANLAEVKIVRI